MPNGAPYTALRGDASTAITPSNWPEAEIAQWLAHWYSWQHWVATLEEPLPQPSSPLQWALAGFVAYAHGRLEEAQHYVEQAQAQPTLPDSLAAAVFAALQAQIAYSQRLWGAVDHHSAQALYFFGKSKKLPMAFQALKHVLQPLLAWWQYQAHQRTSTGLGNRVSATLTLGNQWLATGFHSDYPRLLGKLGYHLVGLACVSHHKQEQLKDRLLALHEALPGLTLVYDALAQWYLQQPDDPVSNPRGQALYWLQKASFRRPNNAATWVLLGQLCDEQGAVHNAIRYYQRAISLNPNLAKAQLGLGRLYVQQQQHEQAVEPLKHALSCTADPVLQADCCHLLGQSYLALDAETRGELAEHLLTQACELNPTEPQYAYVLAMWLFHQGRYAEAETLYRRLIALTPGDAMLTCSLGYLRWLQGDIDGARHLYEQATHLDPAYDVAYNNLGVLYLEHWNDPDTAQQLFARAVDCNHEYAVAHYNLGRTYRANGQLFEAAASFQWARELSGTTQELDDDYLQTELHQLFKSS